jgi:hypothetical protein
MANPSGEPVGDLVFDVISSAPYLSWAFLADQIPNADDSTYRDRIYSMEVTVEPVGRADGIVITRPWVKVSAFARGADRLVEIGRAGIGYDRSFKRDRGGIGGPACVPPSWRRGSAPEKAAPRRGRWHRPAPPCGGGRTIRPTAHQA